MKVFRTQKHYAQHDTWVVNNTYSHANGTKACNNVIQQLSTISFGHACTALKSFHLRLYILEIFTILHDFFWYICPAVHTSVQDQVLCQNIQTKQKWYKNFFSTLNTWAHSSIHEDKYKVRFNWSPVTTRYHEITAMAKFVCFTYIK